MAQPPQADPSKPHAITVAARGTFSETDFRHLAAQGTWQDWTKTSTCSWVPEWTHPQWKEGIEILWDGRQYGARRVVGDPSSMRRPALRAEDDQQRPTEYARRFGVRMGAQRDAWGHSSLTPADPRFQTSGQHPAADEYDRSLQSMLFGYDTAELVDQGAYNPRLQIPWPPNLDEPVDELFRRDKWTQMPYISKDEWPGVFDVRYGPALDGVGGYYDARNPKVWDALQPALQLASRIISSGHPFWEALLDIYHLRPVDEAKDGRSQEDKARTSGVPYASIWQSIDLSDPRVPRPYPEMETLRGLGFDSATAREILLGLLRQKVIFSIGCQNMCYASTMNLPTDQDWHVWISINAALIWPLLVPRHLSDSERALYTFQIAVNLLHELAHACKYAQHCITTRPDILKKTGVGLNLSDAVLASLDRLGTQIFGPKGYSQGGYPLRPSCYDFIMEDESQGEDGMNLEKMIFGGRINTAPAGLQPPTYFLRPVLSLTNWPSTHAQPAHQGSRPADLKENPYESYLLSPRVQSWSDSFAVPVEWYARYLRSSWWQSDHQKYSHQGLKLDHQGAQLPRQLATHLQPTGMYFDEGDIAAVLGEDAYKWLRNTAQPRLLRVRLRILAHHMSVLVCEGAACKSVATRLQNEEEAWKHKSRKLTRIAGAAVTRYQAMFNSVNAIVHSQAPAFFSAQDASERIRRANDDVRLALQSLMEALRNINQEIGYQQNLLGMYITLSRDIRRDLHKHMVSLGRRTASVAGLIDGQTFGFRMTRADQNTVGGGWEAALVQKLTRDLLTNQNIQQPGNNANINNNLSPRPVLPRDVIAAGDTFADLMRNIQSTHVALQSCADLLRETTDVTSFLNPDGSIKSAPPAGQAPPTLRLLTRAKRRGHLGASRPAAMQEMRRLRDGPLKNLVREAVRVVSRKLDVRKEMWLLRTGDERRMEMMADVHLMLVNERQCVLDRKAARESGLPGPVLGQDPTVASVQAKIVAKAMGNADDGAYLMAQWPPEVIQSYLDGTAEVLKDTMGTEVCEDDLMED